MFRCAAALGARRRLTLHYFGPAGTRPRSTLDLPRPSSPSWCTMASSAEPAGPIGSFHTVLHAPLDDARRRPTTPLAPSRRCGPSGWAAARPPAPVSAVRGLHVTAAWSTRSTLGQCSVAEKDGWPRPLVAELLSDEECRTVEADSGASVVELAEAHQPHAIVLDPGAPARRPADGCCARHA